MAHELECALAWALEGHDQFRELKELGLGSTLAAVMVAASKAQGWAAPAKALRASPISRFPRRR